MRGSPLIRALVCWAVLLSAGYPLWGLTHRRPQTAPPAAENRSPQTIHLEMSFTQSAKKLKVLSLGEVVWSEGAPGRNVEKDLELSYPKEGLDLELQWEWTDPELSALRVILKGPDGAKSEHSFWGQGAMDEIVTLGVRR